MPAATLKPSMVVTRKRSCSASEASSTPRGTKTGKQDESGGGNGTTISTRSSARGVVENDTGTTTTTTTPRRTRRFTDSIAETVTSSPRTLRNRQRGSDEAKISDKSESSNDEVAEKIDSSVSQPGKTRSSRNEVERTPAQENNKNAGNKTTCVDPLVLSQPSKSLVKLRDVGTTIPRSPRSKRVSGGDTNSPSTPVRRSRRLSGSGVAEVSEKETPSKNSFTIAKISGMEEKPKEETVKVSVLPAIEEDTEHPDDDHNTKTAYVSEKDQMEEEEKFELRLESDNFDLTADNNVVPSDNAPTNQAAENEMQTIVDQCVVADECDGKDIPVKDVNEHNNKDVPAEKQEEVPSDTAPIKMEAENKMQAIVDQPVVADECDSKDIPVENLDECDRKNVPAEKTQEEGRSEAMETTEVTSMTYVSDIEGSNNTVMKTEGQQDVVLGAETKYDRTEVEGSNDNQESKTESTDLPKPDDIQDRTETSIACSDTHTASNTSDINGNSAKTSDINRLKSVMAGSKKVTKVIPELEEKINQLRSIPKGRPISGRWWKPEKQRFRSINKDATGKKSWSKKMQLKQWRGDVLAKSAVIEAEKQKKKEDLKERQKINKIRREENARKSEIVQVIKDPRKIKKMKRKQLRYLETRDTTNLKQA